MSSKLDVLFRYFFSNIFDKIDRTAFSVVVVFSVSDKSASESINSDLCLKHASGLGRTGHQDRYREENYNPLIIRPQPNREHNIYATRKSLVENLHTAKLQSRPGQFFSYCNEGYASVGHLIEVFSNFFLVNS